MIAKVAELGLGPGIEVVGYQSFRSYPDVPDEEARHFRGLLDQYGLIPTCLGANIDIGRRRDRLMTADEIYDTVERQLITAKNLGFPIMRVPPAAGQLTLENLLSLAEQYGIHLAVELHSPLSVDNPEVVKLRSMYERLQSPYLGFIPDFSTSMTSVPEGHWRNLRAAGAPEELIETAKGIWATDDPTPAKFGALAEACRQFGAGPAVVGQINLTMTMFGHMPVEKWREILPYVRHVHGKYYEVNADGIEPSIPYRDLMHLLKREGYQGTISAEWEGQAHTEEPIGFQQVAAWNAMCKQFLAE
jgi:sugar phosphate isomerase/epimerase